MATRTWTDGGANGNWTDTANWSGATVPVDGDDVVINTSSRVIATNITALDAAKDVFASLTITEGFTGSIGDATTQLECGVTGTANITVAGARIRIGGSGLTVANAIVSFKSQGEYVIVNGTHTTLAAGGNGFVTVGASAVVTTLITTAASVTAAAGTAFTLVIQGSGIISTARAITEYEGSACKLIVTGSATVAASTKAIIGNGCVYNHQSSGAIGGGTVYLLGGGTFTVAGNPNSTAPSFTNLRRASGSTYVGDGPGWTIILTTPTPIGQGGSL